MIKPKTLQSVSEQYGSQGHGHENENKPHKFSYQSKTQKFTHEIYYTYGIVMINILKQLVRRRTDIELQPSGYSFPHAVAS